MLICAARRSCWGAVRPRMLSTCAIRMEERKTHFGFQTIDETQKQGMVGGVFSSVASSYELMNDAMSVS